MSEPAPRDAAWWAGAVAQGLVLGLPLTLAAFRILAFVSAGRVFQYQGF